LRASASFQPLSTRTLRVGEAGRTLKPPSVARGCARCRSSDIDGLQLQGIPDPTAPPEREEGASSRIAKGDRERDAGGHYGPIVRRVESRSPDLAAIHLASIQMGEHGQFRPVERWLPRRTYRSTHDFSPVNSLRLRACAPRLSESEDESAQQRTAGEIVNLFWGYASVFSP
jgi:hypothetical protein